MEVFNITWFDLIISLMMMGGVIALDRVMKLALGKDLAVGTFRVFIQLYIVGFILKWVFHIDHPALVLFVLALMSAMAGYNAVKRSKDMSVKNAVVATGVVIFATIVSAGFVLEVVIRVDPWYNPQYLIPIGGMAMNGAMNGVALGLANLRNAVKNSVPKIECILSLGGTGKQAIAPLLTQSARMALIPTVNGLMTAGIVQLPGMMTGQIIAGLDPTLAVRYQILVYYMLAIGTAVSVIVTMKIASNRYFNKAQQLLRIWES